jgi:tetratricopeptide (TPR) repeat protein
MSAPRLDRSLPELPTGGAASHGVQPASAPPLDRQARALIARIRKNWNDVEAIRALADHYRRGNDYASLANLMEGWGDALEEPRAAADAYVEAADALLMSSRPGDEARLLYERALSRDATHVQALDRLSRVLDEHKNYERLKQVLKYVAHQLQQQPAAPGIRQLLASVHYRLGQVYESHFGEPRKAATLYRQAIEENPRLITAIAAARRLYLEQGNHKTVSVLFEFEIEASPNAEDKQALLLALARHKRELCDDMDGAVLAFRRAVKLAPGSVRALFGLAETLLARSERAEELAAGADRQRAAEVFFHLAQRVPASDAGPYLQRALLVVPNHTQARAMWENLQRASNSPASRPPVARAANGGGADAGAQQQTEAEAWLRDSDLQADDVTSAEFLPIDEDPLSMPRRSPQPPPELLAPQPPRPKPPAPPVAARPAPPAAALQHPRIVNVLADDPRRVSLEVNVGSTTDSNFYVDMSDQLLDGGVFVATYSPLPVGALTMLTITLPGKLVARAHGKVVLTRDLMDAFDDHTPGMCVAFEAVDPKSLALIERFARKRAPMFVEP